MGVEGGASSVALLDAVEAVSWWDEAKEGRIDDIDLESYVFYIYIYTYMIIQLYYTLQIIEYLVHHCFLYYLET